MTQQLSYPAAPAPNSPSEAWSPLPLGTDGPALPLTILPELMGKDTEAHLSFPGRAET